MLRAKHFGNCLLAQINAREEIRFDALRLSHLDPLNVVLHNTKSSSTTYRVRVLSSRAHQTRILLLE